MRERPGGKWREEGGGGIGIGMGQGGYRAAILYSTLYLYSILLRRRPALPLTQSRASSVCKRALWWLPPSSPSPPSSPPPSPPMCRSRVRIAPAATNPPHGATGVVRLRRDGMGWDRASTGWDGMGWDGMGWDGAGWDGSGWDGMGWEAELPAEPPAELPVSSPRFGSRVAFRFASLTSLTGRASPLLEMLCDAGSGSLRLLGLDPAQAATSRSTERPGSVSPRPFSSTSFEESVSVDDIGI